MDFFSEVRKNMGSLLSDEQKEDLQEAGRKFYDSIDIDKFKPIPAEEAKDEQTTLFDEEHFDRIRYLQLQKALNSGLLETDLDDDERKLLTLFKNSS